MKTILTGSAAVLLASLAAPAAGQEQAATIEVVHQLLTPSAGMMNDHMHESGEVMIGLRFERQLYSGANQSGTKAATDNDILAAGYTVRARSMEMDMVMLDLMFAPTDDITLMVMPHFMWHRMEMVGIDPGHTGTGSGHGGGHSGHGHGHELAFGDVHKHGTHGFGDTLLSASYRLVRQRDLRAHLTLGVWAPTGDVGRRNADGTFVHYGMQSGSGTWDVEPALTVSGQSGAVGWGGQAAYRWRTEGANASGFAFGDRARATLWGSYLLSGAVGATGRIEYEHEGSVEGHYNGPHNHSAPSDLQGNYGGDIVSAGLGLNWRLPTGAGRAPQLGAELAVPIYQDLNGVQLPRDWRLSVSLAQTF